ncbi:MAG: recombinase RecA [Oligoflexales bacterium]|nr:recombinase RecA [Oligoflexales bacterium]
MSLGMDKVKLEAIEKAVGAIEKQFGKGAIMRLGDKGFNEVIDTIPTGSLSLDIALGIGGVPVGRVIEIFGPESSGKTTLSLHLVAECQKKGGVAAFVDAEHALDTNYAKRIGVDIEQLLVSQPDTGEQALEIVDMLVRSEAVDLVVIDSVAALTPKAEIEGDMGDHHVGTQARLMSQALRKLTGSISRSHSTVVFINQIRMKIGVMFGNPETTTGGNALKFYSSVRLDVRRVSTIKVGEDNMVGNRVRVKVVKNKVSAPFKQCEFDMMFGAGISKNGEILDIGVEKNIISKSGSWFSYQGERLGQGRESAKIFLDEHPALSLDLERQIKAASGVVVTGATAKDTLTTKKRESDDEDVLSSESEKDKSLKAKKSAGSAKLN